ncbi:MAG: hypothetical protein R3C45_02750 [Phycisphaerales bacterium]
MKPNVTRACGSTATPRSGELLRQLVANSKITGTTRYPESAAKASGNKAGAVMTVAFELNGQPFLAAQRRAELQVHTRRVLPSLLRHAGQVDAASGTGWVPAANIKTVAG